MAKEWLDHLHEIDGRYALEDEIMMLQDKISSVHTINMKITNTIHIY